MTGVAIEEFRMTELGLLPPKWEVVSLGDVAEVSSGGSAPQGKGFFGGQNPFIRVQHLELESNTIRRWDLITDEAVNKYGLKLYSKGTIVFPKSGASIYLEKRAILPIDAYIVSHLSAVISQSSLVDQNFLFYYLRFTRLSEQKAEGYPTLNLTEIKQRRIACPPLTEQKKIAAVLSAVQEAKERTEAVIKALRELKKSLMKHLFTYGPVSLEEAENVPLKETEIGLMPEDWEVVRLGEVVTFSSKPHNLNLSANENVPFVPMEYIPDDRIDIHQYETKKLGEIGSGTFFFKGDLLVAKITPSFENGKQCIVNNLPSNFGYATTEVWPLHQTTSADLLYLFYHLKRKEVGTDIASKMEGSTGRQRVPRHVLQNLHVSLPSLSIQRQITDMLSPIEGKIEAEESNKKSLEALFSTLLSNLMTGKMRVNNLEVPV